MNRRLRKKKNLGEFTQYGFDIKFIAYLTREGQDELIDGMIQLCEANDLAMGGGGGGGLIVEGVAPDYGFFIVAVKPFRTRRGTSYRRASCDESHRELFLAWLGDRVDNLEVGPLADINR
jgi:uncharacterized protein YggL (DUF469 family)